jgi:hypothetical protein
MLGRKQHVIHERSNIIPINIVRNDSSETQKNNNEYSLKQNWFDPTKSSPPNDFMIKLFTRLYNYEKSSFHTNDMIVEKK